MTKEFSSTFSDSNEVSDPNFTDHTWPVSIRLIYGDNSGKFRMDPEAMNALRLVSLFGHAHQGKNFILSQLLGSGGRFPAACIQWSCTEELWMWSALAKRTATDGSEYTLLLPDYEGIDAHKTLDFYLNLTEDNLKLNSSRLLRPSLEACGVLWERHSSQK